MKRRLRRLGGVTAGEVVAAVVGLGLVRAAWQQSGWAVGLAALGCVATMSWYLAALRRLHHEQEQQRRADVWRRRDTDARMREQLHGPQRTWS